MALTRRQKEVIDFLSGFKFVSLVESLATSDFSSALANCLLTYNGGLVSFVIGNSSNSGSSLDFPLVWMKPTRQMSGPV